MANLVVKDGNAVAKYLKQSGAGTDLDPHIPEHLETNSGDALTALQAIEAAVEGTLTVSGSVTVSSAPTTAITAAALPLPSGAATAAAQTTQTGHLATLAGTVADGQVQADIVAALPTGTNTLGKVIGIDGAGNDLEFAKEGDTWNAADHGVILFARDTDTNPDTYRAIQVDADGHLKVNLPDALPAGTNNIGDVDVLTLPALPAGTNNIGDVDVASLPALPAGDNNIGNVDLASAIPAGDNNIGNVDIASALPAGTNLIGTVGAPDIVVTITPTLDTSAYTAGDLLFDSTEIANAVRANGGTAILQSVTIIDKDDQLKPMKLIFADAATDFGTLNNAPDPDDTEAATVIGHYEVSITDAANNIDLGGASVHCHRNIGLLLQAGAATTSIWVAAMTQGTPTHSASGLVLKIGLLRS